MIEKSLLSQEAFAQAVGVSFTTVNRWESGKCKPTFKTMKLIDDFCKAQGIDFNASVLKPAFSIPNARPPAPANNSIVVNI